MDGSKLTTWRRRQSKYIYNVASSSIPSFLMTTKKIDCLGKWSSSEKESPDYTTTILQ